MCVGAFSGSLVYACCLLFDVVICLLFFVCRLLVVACMRVVV